MSNVSEFPNGNQAQAKNQLDAQAKALMAEGVKHATDTTCAHCGCLFFEKAITAKKISGLFTPSSLPMMVLEASTIICKACLRPITQEDLGEKDEDEAAKPDDFPKEG